jgi:hypothetical protein
MRWAKGEGRAGRRWRGALAALALGAAACARRSPPEGAEGAELLLPALGLALRVPAGALVRGGPGGTVIDLDGGARTIAIAPPGTAPPVPREGSRLRDLRGGGIVRYRPAGGDGPEVELAADVTIGGRAYSVRCRARGEPPPPVEWCLPHLESLRPAAPPPE